MEIEFELTGLKLKIKGDSDEVSGKVADLQRQVQGIMNTIGAITQGASAPALPAPAANGSGDKLLETAAETEVAVAPSNGRKQRTARKGVGTRQRAEAIDFEHDADKYGFPKQNWATAQKAMWMIYVWASMAMRRNSRDR